MQRHAIWTVTPEVTAVIASRLPAAPATPAPAPSIIDDGYPPLGPREA